MREWTTVLVAGLVKNLRMQLIQWSWKKADLQIGNICGLRVRLESDPQILSSQRRGYGVIANSDIGL